MNKRKLASSCFVAASLCVSIQTSVYASEGEAREVFSIAAAGAMTFSYKKVIDDISMVFLHFTPAGRASLIGELERTGVVAEAIGKSAAIRGDMPTSAIQVSRRVDGDGFDEYSVSGDMQVRWSRCMEDGRCVPSGTQKTVRVEGVVVQAPANGRPAYRINSLRFVESGR